MSRLGKALVALAAVAITAPAVSGQQQPPVFRSGVQVVEVDARVFDAQGHFVNTLTRDDFEILEDGVPQPIVAMTLIDLLAAVATPPTFPPPTDSTAPTIRNRPTTARQTWIFFFDLNHLTPGAGFTRAREAVEEFIATRFTEGDLAGVLAGNKMVNGRLTTVREELVAAVKSVKPDADQRNLMIETTREWPRFRNEEEALEVARNIPRAIAAAVARACSEDSTACQNADMQVRSKAQRVAGLIQKSTHDTFSAINAMASGLAKVPGPKTIVFLSDGFVSVGMETTLRSIVGQAARAGARVYAIDVRGLNRGGGPTADRMLSDDPAGAGPQFDGREDGVNSLAVDTGGMMIRNENNIGRALDKVASDTNRYYVLGYQPANTNFDGKYRKIEIRVKKPGLKVRARQGYLALEPAKMLVAQPIKAPDPEPAAPAALSPAAALPPGASPTDAAALVTPPHAPPVVAIGAALPAETTMLRIRPDSADRVSALAGAQAAPGDEAARGWSAYQRGDVEAALPLLERAAARPGARPWVSYALGFAYIGSARPHDAIAAWERVRRTAADFQSVYMDLAATYAQVQDVTRALTVLRDAAARWPSDPDVHNGLGVLLIRRSALDDAIAAFTKAAAAAPADALSWLNLGRAYELRYDRARRYDEQLLRWVGPEGDRTQAARSYERCVQLGGPYAQHAADALARMNWSA